MWLGYCNLFASLHIYKCKEWIQLTLEIKVIHTKRAEESLCPMPWASAFIGRASAFIVHNFTTEKWKARSGKSYENLLVSLVLLIK